MAKICIQCMFLVTVDCYFHTNIAPVAVQRKIKLRFLIIRSDKTKILFLSFISCKTGYENEKKITDGKCLNSKVFSETEFSQLSLRWTPLGPIQCPS